MPGVFDGLEILDLSTGIAGPMTAMMLVDNGARVTRIEATIAANEPRASGQRVWTRGMRSAVLYPDHADALAVGRTLAQRADVVIDSFPPDGAGRYRLD